LLLRRADASGENRFAVTAWFTNTSAMASARIPSSDANREGAVGVGV
jgi:hypothetical protein